MRYQYYCEVYKSYIFSNLYRVVSYIKNGWSEDFTDKWSPAVVVSSSLSSQQTVVNSEDGSNDFFPGSVTWKPIRQAVDIMPSFTIQNMMEYFIERVAQDNEKNNDYKNISHKAFPLFSKGHVQKIEVAHDDDKVYIRCEMLPEMKKNGVYKLKMSLLRNGDDKGKVVYASCPCPAVRGSKGDCKHVAATCYALEEFSRLKSTREFESCTSRLQKWNQPRKRKLDAQSVYDIDFSKKIYGREERNSVKPLRDPRRLQDRNSDCSLANKDLLDRIKDVKPNCAFYYLMSNEKSSVKEYELISPIKQHPVSLNEIIDRTKRVKRNLTVTDREREMIANRTKSQSNCQEWYEHRRVRITASKCKRAILRPSTSPTKALREVLNYNDQYQSWQMKQGLIDEKRILKNYERKLGCKVKETGLLVSKSKPFLGASPDGEVDGGLVEIKRIFPNGLSLREAVCMRDICRESCGELEINKSHKFYYQIQLQMFCAEVNWTDLVLSDLHGMIILHVKKCELFISEVIPKLESFYDMHVAPELAYPRVADGNVRLSKFIDVRNC